MPDEPGATPTVTPPPAAPAAQPAATPAVAADPELPDDEPMTTRTFSRLRNSYRALQEEHKGLKAKVTDLEATSGQVNALRQQLVHQAIVNQAHGLFIDPEDASRYLDLDKIKVAPDGKIDTKAIREQLEKVVESKPHLKATNGQARPGVSPARSLPGGGAPRGQETAESARSEVNAAIRRAAGYGERD